jgi:hypothetical protein
MAMARLWLVGLLLMPLISVADTYAEPHPWRREALLQGRDFDYDPRSFLQRLSYQPVFPVPADADGIFGSAGSVSSRELYMDSDVRKTLMFDDQNQWIRLRYRRTEDLDGYLDRQLIGYGLRSGDWLLGVAGDVRGDKAETDVYFEFGWQPDADTLVRANLILPDAYFNQKTSLDAEYLDRARTLFFEWRQHVGGIEWQIALNTSGTIAVLDRGLDVRAEGDQHRGLIMLQGGSDWRWRWRLDGERSDRAFVFDPEGAADEKTFRRRLHSTTLSVQAQQWPLTPMLGVYYLVLQEDGWLGINKSVTARVRNDEPYAFLELTQSLTDRWQWRPAIYAGRTRTLREYQEDPSTDIDRRRGQGKLSLPFSYRTQARNGAYLTISPSFYLHEPAFGGGNVQLHWPF